MTQQEARLPVELLRRLLRLDSATGKLFWRRRTPDHFRSKKRPATALCSTWNARFADREAFTTAQGMGYLHGSIGNEKFLAHRVVFALHHGRWPEGDVDHISGAKKDNRPENLRDVIHAENMRNQRFRASNTSGVMGVSFDRVRNKFEAHITVNGKKLSLGRYSSLDEAKAAREAASKQHNFHKNHGAPAL